MFARHLSAIVVVAVICAPLAGSSDQDTAEVPPKLSVPDIRWAPSTGWTVKGLPPITSALSHASIELLVPTRDSEWVEGDERTILWQWTGPVARIRIYCHYELCKIGGRSRGQRGFNITDLVPNRGWVTWRVPWLDAPGFWLRIAGYDEAGRRVAVDERYVRLRPKEARNIHGTFILVLRDKQRLYFFKDDRLVRMHIVSTARPGYVTPRMAPGTRRRGVRMGQVFTKIRHAWSDRYNCPMPYWLAITSTGSHGIHATTPGAYRRLGRPASHGCIRQHLNDARALYNMVEVGTPVYVF